MTALFDMLDAAPSFAFYAVVGVLLVATAITERAALWRRP